MTKPALRVKEIAKRKGVTIESIAKKLGILPSAISQSISGNPTLERLGEIAAALGVEVAELFEKPVSGAITCPRCGTNIKLSVEEVPVIPVKVQVIHEIQSTPTRIPIEYTGTDIKRTQIQ